MYFVYDFIINNSNNNNNDIGLICVHAGDEDEEEGEEGSKAEEEAEAPSVPSLGDYIMHCLSLFWKVLFAFVPPTGQYLQSVILYPRCCVAVFVSINVSNFRRKLLGFVFL